MVSDLRALVVQTHSHMRSVITQVSEGELTINRITQVSEGELTINRITQVPQGELTIYTITQVSQGELTLNRTCRLPGWLGSCMPRRNLWSHTLYHTL
jgi:hypothetical protein